MSPPTYPDWLGWAGETPKTRLCPLGTLFSHARVKKKTKLDQIQRIAYLPAKRLDALDLLCHVCSKGCLKGSTSMVKSKTSDSKKLLVGKKIFLKSQNLTPRRHMTVNVTVAIVGAIKPHYAAKAPGNEFVAGGLSGCCSWSVLWRVYHGPGLCIVDSLDAARGRPWISQQH